MPRATQQIARSLTLLAPIFASYLSVGQDLQTATATLTSSGETHLQATFLVHLQPVTAHPVLDAPYSAGKLQHCGGGDRILQTINRDSHGRTRIERPKSFASNALQAPALIEIVDPQSQLSYVLDPQTRIAHRYHPPAPGTSTEFVRPAEAGIAISRNSLRHPSTQPATEDAPPKPPRTITATRPEAVPPSTIDLGEKRIEGLLVHGIRISTPTASGDGTLRHTLSETWSSPDLQIVVLTQSVDHPGGDCSIRLTHLTRAEPDPTLFQVPSGYRIADETTDFPITVNSAEAHIP